MNVNTCNSLLFLSHWSNLTCLLVVLYGSDIDGRVEQSHTWGDPSWVVVFFREGWMDVCMCS